MLKRIFVVDDSPHILALFTDLLTDAGYIVVTQNYPIVRAEEVRRAAPDLIILDHWLHNHRRSQVAVECIRQHTDLAHIPIIICTGFRNAPMALATVFKEKNVTVLSKPFNIDDLFDMVTLRIMTAEA
jgi:two-component system, NtrC family, nitrogen regulation response regulator NtrX